MKFFNILACIFAVLVSSGAVHGRVVFNDAEDSDSSDLPKVETPVSASISQPEVAPIVDSNPVILPETEAESPKSNAEASPIFPQEEGTEAEVEPEGPKNEVPVVPAGATDGRTFHHLAKLHHKLESKVHHLFGKLIYPFLPHPEFFEEQPHQPHYFQQSPYYGNYNYDIYRKDRVEPEETSPIKAALKPLEYFVNHPFNFKERLANLHHKLGKRSIDDTSSTRQGKTLHKLIPHFETNVNSLLKRVLGPIYGSKPTGGFFLDETPYKSTLPAQSTPMIKYTNLMRMLPQIIQRMGQMLRFPQLYGTPTVQHP